MLTLGIETSCDETAAALVEDGKVLSNEISSSVHLHSPYGGVVPEIASRFHVEYIAPVLKKALEDAGKNIEDIDLISVTDSPGLPGSLLVGISFAKAISFALKKPLLGVNHLKAHLISAFIKKDGSYSVLDKFPFLGLVVSGGHTSIYDCRSIDDFRLIGSTLDDAIGEAFDKVAKILELGYPGGPVVEKRALKFKGEDTIKFPRALMKNSPGVDFSFSGIKTAVMYYWKDAVKNEEEIDKICFCFQNAVKEVIDLKLAEAITKTNTKRVAAGGGVIHNEIIRNTIMKRCMSEQVALDLPLKKYCTDNAAMTAVLGEVLFKKGHKSDLYLNAKPTDAIN